MAVDPGDLLAAFLAGGVALGMALAAPAAGLFGWPRDRRGDRRCGPSDTFKWKRYL